MTKEELESKLQYYQLKPYIGPKIKEDSEVKLEWINPDKLDYSRTLKVTTNLGYSFNILWYCNLLTIQLDNNIEAWADDLIITATYPSSDAKLWLELIYNGDKTGIHIPIKGYSNEQKETN